MQLSVTCRSGQEYRDIMNVNVVGTFLVTKAFLPLLKKKESRTIVNISSGLGSVSGNRSMLPERPILAKSLMAYNSSKSAVNMRESTALLLLFAHGMACSSSRQQIQQLENYGSQSSQGLLVNAALQMCHQTNTIRDSHTASGACHSASSLPRITDIGACIPVAVAPTLPVALLHLHQCSDEYTANAAVEKNPKWHAVAGSAVHKDKCGRQKGFSKPFAEICTIIHAATPCCDGGCVAVPRQLLWKLLRRSCLPEAGYAACKHSTASLDMHE